MSKHFKDNLAETVFHILAESHYKGKTVIVAGKKGIVGKQVGKDGDTENDEIYKVRFEDGTVKDIPVRDMEIQSDDNKKTGENEMEDLVKEAKTPLVITDPSKRARKETTPEREKPGKDVLVRTGPGGDFTKDIKTTDVKKGMRGILGLFKKESVELDEAKPADGKVTVKTKSGHKEKVSQDDLRAGADLFDTIKNIVNTANTPKKVNESVPAPLETSTKADGHSKIGPGDAGYASRPRPGYEAGLKATIAKADAFLKSIRRPKAPQMGPKPGGSQSSLFGSRYPKASPDALTRARSAVGRGFREADTQNKRPETTLGNLSLKRPRPAPKTDIDARLSKRPPAPKTPASKTTPNVNEIALPEGSLGYKKALRAKGKKKKGMRSGDAKEKAMDFRRAASEEQKNKENHQLDEAPWAAAALPAVGKGLMWGLTALGIGSAIYQGVKGDKPKGSGGSSPSPGASQDRAAEKRAANIERAKQSGSIYQRPASKTTPKDAFHRVTSGTRHLRKPRIPQSSMGARSRFKMREQVEIVESAALAGRALGGLARGGRALGQQGVRGNLTARLARTKAFRNMAAAAKKKGAGKTGLKKFARDKSVIPLAKASGAKVQKATTRPISGKASKAKKTSKSAATGLNLKDIPVGKIMMYPGMPGFNFAMDAVTGTARAVTSPFRDKSRQSSYSAYMEQKSNDGE